MRLERLEIAGFKSFSDRAEVAFDRGVTAIVGPNGCGKSNLADAITWVLGEQSAKSLRGERMEDVIFNGSDARKPTGAAEVRLRLSDVPVPPTVLKDPGVYTPAIEVGNGNGSGNGAGAHVADLIEAVREVEVTRRLYRSGESEYLIDGEICRLRDVHELLMDTGLGAKAYAIIEQGKIGMILSSRPTDRRALIEEAAGITKYKARRRAAELKLEAARQNLTRIDDIVFEVEKQRSSLKRQAAKARRYTRLRDEMRRWEKVLFARRYRGLADMIESGRARLDEARDNEAAASARLAEVENELGALRLRLVDAEAEATRQREAAHARELEINRRQQQIALDTQQAGMFEARSAELALELEQLDARREPDRRGLEGARTAAVEAERNRDEAAALEMSTEAAHREAQQEIEKVERRVEQDRDDVYAAMNTITALEAALQSSTAERDRGAEALARLDVETADLRTEYGKAMAARQAATEALARSRATHEATSITRAGRELELAGVRVEHERLTRELRSREHELASMTARLHSLEELDAHRAGFSDAARMVLARANGQVGHLGALADFLDVEPRFERAVEACLGDLLQHVLVEGHDQAAAGLALVREEDAGRCGFIVVGRTGWPGATGAAGASGAAGAAGASGAAGAAGAAGAPGAVSASSASSASSAASVAALSSVVRIAGPHADAIREALGEALIVETFEEARRLAVEARVGVVTVDGDVFHGPNVVSGGGKAGSRGILATKREIKDLRESVTAAQAALDRHREATAGFERTLGETSAAIAALTTELHDQEKAIVGVEAQLERAVDDGARLEQRAGLVAQETSRCRQEIDSLDARQAEARESIARLGEQKRQAEEALASAVERLSAAREAADALGRQAADASRAHAALVERAASAAADVSRLEAAAGELARRVESCTSDLRLMASQRERLTAAVADGQRLMDEDVRRLDVIREEMQSADDRALELKAGTDRQEEIIRDARRALDALRALVAELDVGRATAESDLAHLAQQSIDVVGQALDEVRREVDEMEAAGMIEPDARAIRAAEAPDPDELEPAGGGEDTAAAVVSDEPVGPMSAEEAIAELRAKIDRLGPVNMMAIHQFDELEERHTFLSTQRQDLIDSIAQTNEAIEKIDETTHARFRDAFVAINTNFQQTFSTLFGGGRAGLTLLDEGDPLESGIDIVASPPGKRLQNVQLLSGGEKALTAIALMFAIFRYKPSPFCVLDEIDAPLDDANIGRFVEMLRGMLDRTQFIIITHNRKTMEIANRLYGVTMEEPGVSKLISVQLN
jgi:chromosome segregation protein